MSLELTLQKSFSGLFFLFDLITIYIRESIANSVADIIVESVKLNANIKEKTIYISIAFRTANNEIGGTTMLYSDGKFSTR